MITGGSEFTVNFKGALPVPPLLVALTITLEVPAPVGIPEIKPETLFTVRPAGNPVATDFARFTEVRWCNPLAT